MKNLIATAAILMSLASSTSAQEMNPTQEYRLWSAEQMINRVAEKFARVRNICDKADLQMLRLSESCKTSVLNAYPILKTIRDVARSGDPVRWAALIDVVHKMESDIDGPLNDLERR